MLTFAAIPFLFRATKDQAVDRNLGELSYLIYICHYLVNWFLDSVMAFGSNMIRGIAIIGLTILVSSALYWWVGRPIDSWRQRRLLAKRIAEPIVAGQMASN
jgi:peptidoglycan/LPS O-acetylase OafA/YrhL